MNSLNGYPLYDRRKVSDNRQRFMREPIPELAYANSLCVSTGQDAVRGWVLIRFDHYQNIDKYSTNLELDIGDPNIEDNIDTLKNLSIVQAQCVTRGIASDANAIYLVELTDARGIYHNKWFQFPLNAAYNIRAPAYPDVFYTNSMNGGTTWTWATMLQDIWERMPLLGSWPGLPYVPAGTPEGFWYTGVSALASMCDVLDYLGLTIAVDLTSEFTPYTIVTVGATDTAFTTLQTQYINRLEDDQEWIDIGAGRVPRYVKVLFRRRNTVYGTEELVRRDSYQWSTDAVYTVSIDAPVLFTNAVGTHHIWSDFTVRYDINGDPLAEDVAIASHIARERVSQYFDRIYNRTSGYMLQLYTGALPFTTGSQVESICWYHGVYGKGWKTRIGRGADLPLPGNYN